MSTDPKKRKRAWLPASPFVSPARAIGDVAAASLARLLGRRGLANMEIFAHWPEIVGAELADTCAPEKIAWPREAARGDTEPRQAPRGAVLHVRVEGPRAVEIQHRSGEIIARINQLFGFPAVDRIRIFQAPLPRPQRRREPPDPAKPAIAPASPVEGDPLAAALARLARGVKKE